MSCKTLQRENDRRDREGKERVVCGEVGTDRMTGWGLSHARHGLV